MSDPGTEDTIVAVATPPGRSALALVRLSGPDVGRLARLVLDPYPAQPRHATLSRVRDSDGGTVDEVIALRYAAPASFTGDDVLELICHGGAITAPTIVAAFVVHGARPADPGEFTRRALLNGKLDLIQAEAIGDIIDAQSRPSQQVALRQLDGGLSRRILALRERVIELEALCAYDIDFPEEDDGPIPAGRILGAARATIADVDALLATAPAGEIVRAGAVVVIAGAPNVGKSSLFNALLGRRRAIVTAVPGTTRDALEAMTETEGWPIRLVDTAGLRDTADVVERLGIEISQDYASRADVLLVCGDSDDALRDAREAVGDRSAAAVIEVHTKADTVGTASRDSRRAGVLWASAETGEGLAGIASAIAAALAARHGAITLDAPLVTRERQRVGLSRARDELSRFLEAWETERVPPVVAAVHLREAGRHLEELIGTIDVEDVLDRLFSAFCVGK